MAEQKAKDESYFNISKYAHINWIALSLNMMRYGLMDECAIGTDWRCATRLTITWEDNETTTPQQITTTTTKITTTTIFYLTLKELSTI